MQGVEKIKAISFKEDLVGKTLGVSKKMLTWTFEVRGRVRAFSLSYSAFSGTFRVFFDNELIHEGNRNLLSQFAYDACVEGTQLSVREGFFTFEFSINGVPFQPGTVLRPADAPRQTVGSTRQIPHKLSMRESPTIFDDASANKSVLRTGHNLTRAQTENFRDVNLMGASPMMRRKNTPDIDLFSNGPPPTDFLSAQAPGKTPADQRGVGLELAQLPSARGIRLHRPPNEMRKKSDDSITPSAFRTQPRDTVQMPAIFTEMNIRRVFKVPRGPPLVFDKFDQFESEPERFAATDFDSYSSMERRVLESLFETGRLN